MVKDVVEGEAMVEPAVRSPGALLKRAEQLKRWEESETNKADLFSPQTFSRRPKVQFPKGCVFLAACASGDLDEVKSLLATGSDINTANVDGLTALHQAVIDQNSEMVQYLVSNGADIDAQDNEGWTPLMAGVSCNFLDIVRYLLSKQADPVLPNNDGELPIDLAETDEMRQILEKEIRLRGINIDDARLREQQLMLKDAMEWSNSKKITKEQRHPVTSATSVHVAAAKGYCKVLKILLQAGADVNAKDNDGWTPLHGAAHWSEREACEILAEHGANMDEVNNLGFTCFDVADPEILPFLENLKEKQKILNSAQKPQRFGPPVIIPSEPPAQLPSWRLTGRRLAAQPSNGSAPPAIGVTGVATAIQSQQPTSTMAAATGASHCQTTSSSAGVTSGHGTAPATSYVTSTTTNTTPYTAANQNEPKNAALSSSRSSAPINSSSSSSSSSTNPDEVIRWRKRPDEQQQSSPMVVNEDKKNISLPPQRGDESESERKLRAKRERESRRSTQGITLETVKAAEQLFTDKRKTSSSSSSDENKKHQQPNIPNKSDETNHKKASPASESKNVPPFLSYSAPESNNVSNEYGKDSKMIKSASSGATSNNNTAPTRVMVNSNVGDSREKYSSKQTPYAGCTVGTTAIAYPVHQTRLVSEPAGYKETSDSSSVENSEKDKQQPTAMNRRRVRNSRRSTGPIAQDDVQLALENEPDSAAAGSAISQSATTISSTSAASTISSSASTISSTDNNNSINSANKNPNPDPNITKDQYHQQQKVHFSTPGWRFVAAEEKNRDKSQLSKPSSDLPNLSDYRNNRSQFAVNTIEAAAPGNERYISRTSSGVSVASTASHDVEVDYKKLYEKEILENDRLRKIINEMEKSLESMKFNAKQASGDGTHIVPYNSRLEKLAADLDDEKRTKEQILADNTRLKEENGALIRVISKLSKSK